MLKYFSGWGGANDLPTKLAETEAGSKYIFILFQYVINLKKYIACIVISPYLHAFECVHTKALHVSNSVVW